MVINHLGLLRELRNHAEYSDAIIIARMGISV